MKKPGLLACCRSSAQAFYRRRGTSARYGLASTQTLTTLPVLRLMGLAMTTFIASTITEAAKTDNNRFEMTFVDADGKRHTVSIPSAIAADLVPLLEQVAADQAQIDG